MIGISKLVDRIAQAGTLRSIYQALASVCAVVTIGAWGWFTLPTVPGMDHKVTMPGRTPVTVLYQLLCFFGIPHGWVHHVAGYLASSPSRTSVLGVAGTVAGCAVTFTLMPHNGEAPSLQASTWWVCATVSTQCGGLRDMVVTAVVWIVGRAIWQRKRNWWEGPVLDVFQLFAAVFMVPMLMLRVVFDGFGPRR